MTPESTTALGETDDGSSVPADRKAWKGRGLCLSAALVWSTSGLFIKSLTRAPELGGDAWSGLQVAGVRSLFAFPLLLVLSGRVRLPGRRELVVAACTAVVMVSYSLAQTYTATANAILLQYASPVYVIVLAPFLLGEKPAVRDAVAAPVLAAGIILIFVSSGSGGGTLLGNVMGIVAGVGYAGIVLSLRKWPGAGGLSGLAWGNALAAAVAVPLAAILDGGLVGPTLASGAKILYLGLIQIGLGYFLFERAVRSLRAIEAGLLTMVEPVACPFWSFLALGERPEAAAVAGGALILATLSAHTVAAGLGEKPT